MLTFNDLMYGGPRWELYTVANFTGGGPSAPDPVDPFKEAQAQIQLERERAAITEEQRIAAEGRTSAKREVDLGIFNTNLDTAFSSAQQEGSNIFEREGLDLDRFMPLLMEQLQLTRERVPELSSNPASFFNPQTTTRGILDRTLTRDRRDFNRSIDQFAGDNFASTMIPGSFDDSIIDRILQEQFTDASSQINRSRDRGSLSDFGFTTALSNLETGRAAAGSRLQELGGGILETNRGALRDIGTQARSRADSFQFGDSFDPAGFNTRIQDLFGEQTGRLEGDIRGALGGESLFNIGDILARASSAQGAQNNVAQSPALLSAIAQRDEERQRSRGIGTQGAF